MSPVRPIWPRIGNPDSHDALVSGTKDPSYSEKTVKHGRERLGMKKCQNTLVAQMVKNLPVMQENWVQSLGWEDSLEKGMANTPILLPPPPPRTEKPGGLQSVGSDKTEQLPLSSTC